MALSPIEKGVINVTTKKDVRKEVLKEVGKLLDTSKRDLQEMCEAKGMTYRMSSANTILIKMLLGL